MSSRPLEVLLHHMPGIADRGDTRWARDFARSVLRQSRNPKWKPSAKQEEIMQRLVADFLGEADQSVLVEDAD